MAEGRLRPSGLRRELDELPNEHGLELWKSCPQVWPSSWVGSSRAHAAAVAMPPGTKGHQCHQPHPTLGKGGGNFSFPVTYPSHTDAVFHRDSAQVAQRLGSSDNAEGFFFFLIYPSFRSFYHNRWRKRCVCHSPLRGICPQGDRTATSAPSPLHHF